MIEADLRESGLFWRSLGLAKNPEGVRKFECWPEF